MADIRIASLIDHLSAIEDPRVDRRRRHNLEDILILAICSIIGGADDWVSIEMFCRAKEAWFRTFLELPNGIPSHDTFGRVFAALDPAAFQRAFAAWIHDVTHLPDGTVVAIDGKTVRRSFDRARGKSAIHMVSAWASEVGVALGQVTTDEKSNEITAVPRLLELLHIAGCIVTIDAMGCQTAIAEEIVNKEADYVLQVKANQPTLHAELEAYFEHALANDFVGVEHDFFEASERGHGRKEVRRVWSTNDVSALSDARRWAKLNTIAMLDSERTVNGTTSRERRYVISSLPKASAALIARAMRKHWGIENGLHWVLDIALREDENRVRAHHAAENFALMRHVALNMLKAENSKKLGIKNKRLKAGWSGDYLLQVLGAGADI
jgi:predicted transposase YbfD/YdcC